MKTPRPPWLMVLAVLAAHLLLGREVQRLHQGRLSAAQSSVPARMQVEFVQEMAQQAPPAAPLRPAQARAAQRRPTAAPLPAVAAAPIPAEAASAPEPEPASVVPRGPETVAAAAAAPAEPAASPGPQADDPGPEWPLSTRLSYDVTGNYRGPVNGQAQVEWLRKGRQYQIHIDVAIGPSFAPLVTRRLSSEGVLTVHGIAPQSYDEETRRIFADPRRLTLQFLGGTQSAGHGRGAYQDAASQFVQLTWLFLTQREFPEPGRIVELPLQLPSGPRSLQYEVIGEETLDTPMGPLQAWQLRPRQAARGGDLSAEVWLAPSLQYLPVRFVIRQDADTYIDLMLRRAPLQAAPESANGPQGDSRNDP